YLQADDAIRFLAASRQHKYRNRRELLMAAKLTAYFKAVHSRQHEVEYYEIRRLATDFRKRQAAVRCIANLITFLLQVVFQQFDEVVLVFNDQDLFHHGIFIKP